MKLIKELDFRPLDKFVVELPAKPRTFMSDFTVVDKERSTEESTATKVVKKAAKYNHQAMLVVATPKGEEDINIGDSIVCDFRACMPLDGYDGLYMIPKYNVLGIVDAVS